MSFRSLTRTCTTLFLLATMLLVLPGCSTPCQKLSALICTEFKDESKLCTIAKQESTMSGVSQSRCRALLSTWSSIGQLQTQSLGKRYQRYKKKVLTRLPQKKSGQRVG